MDVMYLTHSLARALSNGICIPHDFIPSIALSLMDPSLLFRRQSSSMRFCNVPRMG